MPLLTGRVICMGSPGGLKEPRTLLKLGDAVEVEVEGIGVLFKERTSGAWKNGKKFRKIS